MSTVRCQCNYTCAIRFLAGTERGAYASATAAHPMSTRRAIPDRLACVGARRFSTFTLRLSRITTRRERLALCASAPPPCRIRAISAPTSNGRGCRALGASCLRIRARATVVACTRSWPRPPHLTSRSRRTAFGSRLNSNVSALKNSGALCPRHCCNCNPRPHRYAPLRLPSRGDWSTDRKSGN